jgi:hypothetical protein
MGVQLNEDKYGVFTTTLNVAQIAQATSAEQTFPITGLKIGDFVAVSKPTLHAGVGIVNARVSAKDTLAIQFLNTTAGAITPGSEPYSVFWFRPERTVRAPS